MHEITGSQIRGVDSSKIHLARRPRSGARATRAGRLRTMLRLLVATLALGLVEPLRAAAAEWAPAAFAKEDTLKLATVCPQEGEYWFPVWLVVIDGQVYVRLGTRAAGRIACNSKAPYVGVEVAGQRFERVRGVPAPDYADRVAKAMADKYTSDIFVHWFSHPLTLRLVPEN